MNSGERFVYAYYDGVDKIAHERGFGPFYEAEIAAADWLVGALLSALPPGTTLVVTADHGQVQIDEPAIKLPKDLMECVHHQSGEGRFRWLHARRGSEDDLLSISQALFSHQAWVVSREQVIEEAWLGPSKGAKMSDSVARRLGDVALVPFADVTYEDPLDSGPFPLICRHGSLTSAEMYVPFLAATV